MYILNLYLSFITILFSKGRDWCKRRQFSQHRWGWSGSFGKRALCCRGSEGETSDFGLREDITDFPVGREENSVRAVYGSAAVLPRHGAGWHLDGQTRGEVWLPCYFWIWLICKSQCNGLGTHLYWTTLKIL